MPTTQALDAQALFQAAYENRYTWDENFPGFSADVTLCQGDISHHGQVTVTANFQVTVTGIESEEIQKEIQRPLQEVVTHRKRNSFQASHGKNTFTVGDTDATGSVEILVTGDAMGSNYRVRNNQVVYVSRVMGGMAFAIDHLAALDTGEGYISTHYKAIFRQPQSNQVLQDVEFLDTYEKVGGYFLLSKKVVHVSEQGQTTTTELTLSNLQLLES
ncbi:DUF3386 domain-containing protein [Synechococcus sp. PCC 6312]|uniref:DUF3386 domain-containing protein n=1 Tax=Synechococcus sp. (strain ATCC 27167 / PCC 6312) TaxID=195253 RepID=UPI00029F1A23|nr:DUF3386 domain-containing protein [Synechococcus sp. PCC 6312]AFY60786.1 Protein of unknown function (DUF3386) [Synechococcus sp. PCC 6312]